MELQLQSTPGSDIISTINLSDVGALYITKLYGNLIYQYLKCKLVGDSLATIGAIEELEDKILEAANMPGEYVIFSISKLYIEINQIIDKYDFNQVDITYPNENEIDVKFKNIELQIYLRDMNISSITGKSSKGYTLLYNFEDPAYKCTWWN